MVWTDIQNGESGASVRTKLNALGQKFDTYPKDYAFGLAATWSISHGLNRVPAVQVFLSSGEQVLSDVVSTLTQVVVTHNQPQQGFVVLI